MVASETGVLLLDEHDSPTLLCEIVDEPGVRMNEGSCDPQGRFWCGTMAYDMHSGGGKLYRVERDGAYATVLPDVTISNGLAWTADGATVFYVDSMAHGVDTFTYDPRAVNSPAGAASPTSMRAWDSRTASRSTPRAASGLRSGTAARCAATRPTGSSTPSYRSPAGA